MAAYPNPHAPQPANVAPSRGPLATIAYLCVIAATFGYGCRSVKEEIAAAASFAKPSSLFEQLAYTNASAAHVTLTNLNAFPIQTCVKGVIEAKGSKADKIETVAVCTGDVKPRSTVVLEAPWRVGAVEKLCSGEPDRFGNTHLDWSRCTFDLAPVP